jgi:hypothetical protein
LLRAVAGARVEALHVLLGRHAPWLRVRLMRTDLPPVRQIGNMIFDDLAGEVTPVHRYWAAALPVAVLVLVLANRETPRPVRRGSAGARKRGNAARVITVR